MNIEFLRSFRIGPFAIFDFAVSFIFVLLLAPLLKKGFKKIGLIVGTEQLLWWTVPVSVVVHALVGSFTPLTKAAIDLHGGYLVKLVLLAMILIGIYRSPTRRKTKKNHK